MKLPTRLALRAHTAQDQLPLTRLSPHLPDSPPHPTFLNHPISGFALALPGLEVLTHRYNPTVEAGPQASGPWGTLVIPPVYPFPGLTGLDGLVW